MDRENLRRRHSGASSTCITGNRQHNSEAREVRAKIRAKVCMATTACQWPGYPAQVIRSLCGCHGGVFIRAFFEPTLVNGGDKL